MKKIVFAILLLTLTACENTSDRTVEFPDFSQGGISGTSTSRDSSIATINAGVDLDPLVNVFGNSNGISGSNRGSTRRRSGGSANLEIETSSPVYDEDNSPGYLAQPVEGGPFPGVLIIHDQWGLDDDIRLYTEELAKEGYIALAVDLFDGESTDDPARAARLASDITGSPNGTYRILRAGIAYLKQQPNLDQTDLAAIGWGLGGTWSYELAKNNFITGATVIYYGDISPDDVPEAMTADTLAHFDRNDTAVSVGNLYDWRRTLEAQGGRHELYLYSGDGAGFARTLKSKESQEAWQRTLEFLAGN